MNEAIFSARRVLGLKPLSTPEGRLLLILRRDAQGQEGFVVLQEQSKGWSELKRLRGPAQVQAMDAQLIEGEVWVASEVNTDWPVEVSRCRLSELLDGKQSPLELQQVGLAELSREQAQRVMLPVTLEWNVAGPLSPSQWLFSPRFVSGAEPGTLIVNTADGQAMWVSTGGLKEGARQFALAQAFMPQAMTQASSDKTVAFLRMTEEGAELPYWSLSRYHGRPGPRPGALMIAENGGPERDLSQSLGLGPILGFQLVVEHAQLWLFALKDVAVGTQVIALQRGTEGWKVRGTLDMDQDVQDLAIASHGPGWSIFLVVEDKTGASIHHRSWRIP